jgi:hypothetical protein
MRLFCCVHTRYTTIVIPERYYTQVICLNLRDFIIACIRLRVAVPIMYVTPCINFSRRPSVINHKQKKGVNNKCIAFTLDTVQVGVYVICL